MAKHVKSKPALTPGRSTSLREGLVRIRRHPEEIRDMRVSLRVSGGVSGQAYNFDFEASGQGEVACTVRCELTGREGRSRRRRLPTDRFLALLDRIRANKLLELPPEPTGFLPDTLVGYLEVSDGDHVYRSYFAADAEQAKTQSRPVPRGLARVIDEIYRLGAELTGVKSVKP